MNRANPETFPDKFKKHGVTPMRGRFIMTETGTDTLCAACALGIEGIDAAGIERAAGRYSPGSSLLHLAMICGFEDFYAMGLSEGWEGGDVPNYVIEDDRDNLYLQGYYDGRAAWQACVDAGLI